jgi:N6-adenosine-specific RNA methylase IME4
MNNKFQILLLDPAWSFQDKLENNDTPRGAESNYKTMTLDDIKALKVNELADPDGCVLALWVPSSLLQDGLDVMKKFNFEMKQTYIWVKTKKSPLEEVSDLFNSSIKSVTLDNLKSFKSSFGNLIKDVNLSSVLAFFMGRLFRQTHEICLIGINNTKIYKKLMNKSQRSVSFGENKKHSEKPEHLHNSLDLMFPSTSEYKINKLELFARRQKNGWLCCGNEAPMTFGEDLRDNIDKIINCPNEQFLELMKLTSEADNASNKELREKWKEIQV